VCIARAKLLHKQGEVKQGIELLELLLNKADDSSPSAEMGKIRLAKIRWMEEAGFERSAVNIEYAALSK
jgi:hypothetical protein